MPQEPDGTQQEAGRERRIRTPESGEGKSPQTDLLPGDARDQHVGEPDNEDGRVGGRQGERAPECPVDDDGEQ